MSNYLIMLTMQERESHHLFSSVHLITGIVSALSALTGSGLGGIGGAIARILK